MKKGKVLFFYPNSEGYGGIPNGIALLSACLKEASFETRCFDTTFLKSPPIDHLQRQKHGGIIKSNASVVWGKWTPELAKKVPGLFVKRIEEFKPDLIAVSFAEVTYTYGISLLEGIKKKFNIPVIAGGILPTLSPELVINNDCIDVTCVGEGEEALVELANCIVKGEDYSNIKNLWVKRNSELIKRGDRYGHRREKVIIDREQNVGIDDELDFWLAEQILRRRRAVGNEGSFRKTK